MATVHARKRGNKWEYRFEAASVAGQRKQICKSGYLSKKEAMYAYEFEGRRYDVGDKLGFLEATVDFALKKPELQGPFMEYLKKVCSERTVEKEVALSAELTSEDDNTEK